MVQGRNQSSINGGSSKEDSAAHASGKKLFERATPGIYNPIQGAWRPDPNLRPGPDNHLFKVKQGQPIQEAKAIPGFDINNPRPPPVASQTSVLGSPSKRNLTSDQVVEPSQIQKIQVQQVNANQYAKEQSFTGRDSMFEQRNVPLDLPS